jgi:hypothetical protein
MIAVRIPVFHRLHHQPGKRLVHVTLSAPIPGMFLDASGMLSSQGYKCLFPTQRPKLSPQKFSLREAKNPQTLRACAHYQ